LLQYIQIYYVVTCLEVAQVNAKRFRGEADFFLEKYVAIHLNGKVARDCVGECFQLQSVGALCAGTYANPDLRVTIAGVATGPPPERLFFDLMPAFAQAHKRQILINAAYLGRAGRGHIYQRVIIFVSRPIRIEFV
jgi:hypothetical protein